jgi:hypothetical protein
MISYNKSISTCFNQSPTFQPVTDLKLEPVAQVLLPRGFLPLEGCFVDISSTEAVVLSSSLEKTSPAEFYNTDQPGMLFLHRINLETGEETRRKELLTSKHKFDKLGSAVVVKHTKTVVVKDAKGVHFFSGDPLVSAYFQNFAMMF